MTQQSCKKEQTAGTNSKNVYTKDYARTISGQEATDLVDKVNDFYNFTEELNNTGSANYPSSIPANVSVEDAQNLIADLFNCHFARLNYELFNATYDTVNFTLPKTSEGINLTQVGFEFISLRAHLRTVYESVTATPKQFTGVYIKLLEEDEASATYQIISTVNHDNPPEGLLVKDYPNIRVGANDWWSVKPLGGLKGVQITGLVKRVPPKFILTL